MGQIVVLDSEMEVLCKSRVNGEKLRIDPRHKGKKKVGVRKEVRQGLI